MSFQKLNDNISKNSTSLKIVWLLLLSAILFYFILSILFNTDKTVSFDKLEQLFLLSALILSGCSVYIFKKFLSENFLKYYISNIETDDSSVDNLSTKEKKLKKLLNYLFIPHIIVWGINELIVILGFILSYLTKNFETMIPFTLVAVFLHCYMYPRVNSLMDNAKKWEI